MHMAQDNAFGADEALPLFILIIISLGLNSTCTDIVFSLLVVLLRGQPANAPQCA